MAKYKETCDLYDDEGKLLKSNVSLEKISPLVNPGVKKIIDLTKRTVALNLAGLDEAIKTGKMGGKGNQILGRGIKVDCVKDADALSKAIKEMVSVSDGDNTKVTKVGGGKMLLVEVPTARIEAAATYDAAITAVAAAATMAVIKQYKIGMFEAPYVKSAVWGSYPVTMGPDGGAVSMILSIPQNNEGLGFALRNVPANHVAMMTHRNAIQASALSSTFEQAGEFEMGMAIGEFERAQLLLYAYQGLNANNLLYDLVKKNGKTGTIGTVVQSLVEKAIEDKVIKAGKKGKSGLHFLRYKGPDALECLLCCRNPRRNHGQLWCRPVRTGSILNPVVLQRPPRARDRPPRLRLRSCHGNSSRVLLLQPLDLWWRRSRCLQRKPRRDQARSRCRNPVCRCSLCT